MGLDNKIFESDGQIKRILRGVSIVNGVKRKPDRTPITIEVLSELVRACNSHTFDGVILKAAMCLAFAGFLRVGEFTYDKWDSTSPTIAVTRSSITFEPKTVSLLLPRSKSDPFRKGITIPMPATDKDTCPRRAIKLLFKLYPAPGNTPLFCRESIDGYKNQRFFTRKWFINNVHDLLLKAGINPAGYNGHSFRRGAAHTVAAAGMSDNEIKTLGRWAGPAFKLYTGQNDARWLSVAKNLTTKNPHTDAAPPLDHRR